VTNEYRSSKTQTESSRIARKRLDAFSFHMIHVMAFTWRQLIWYNSFDHFSGEEEYSRMVIIISDVDIHQMIW